MKLNNRYINLLLIALFAITTTSCDLFELRDRSFNTDDPQVEFFPLSESVSGDGSININVQLIGEQRASDLPLSVTIVGESTTAVEGTHFSLPSTSVTIEANSSTAPFTINYTGSNVTSGPVVLVLELQGTDEVRAAPNLRRHTLTISN